LRLLEDPFHAITPFAMQLVQVLRSDPTTDEKRPSSLVRFVGDAARASSAFLLHLNMLIGAEEPGSLCEPHRVVQRTLADIAGRSAFVGALVEQNRYIWGDDGLLTNLGKDIRERLSGGGDNRRTSAHAAAKESPPSSSSVTSSSSALCRSNWTKMSTTTAGASSSSHWGAYVPLANGAKPSARFLDLKPLLHDDDNDDDDLANVDDVSDRMSGGSGGGGSANSLWKASMESMESQVQSGLNSGSKLRIMFKEGDDLRQDSAILQFLSVMNHFWKEAGLHLPMVIYRVQPTGYRKGIVEMVPDSMTWQDIRDKFGRDDQAPIRYLHVHNPTARMFDAALDRFTRSLAAYFVATGVTGLGDRHQDNIMMAKNGLFFHIDFGLCLGRKTQQMGILRERYHGSLLTTGLMAVVSARSGVGIDPKNYFIRLCSKALRVLQQPLAAATMQQLLILMKSSGADDLYRIEHVGLSQNFLRPHWPRHQTETWIANLVEKNMGSGVNYWRNVEQGVRKALAGGKAAAASEAKRLANPAIKKLAINFGCAQMVPFCGCFRVGPLIAEESTVLASKARPFSLCFNGVASSRFAVQRKSRGSERASERAARTIKFFLGDSSLLKAQSPRGARCRWKNWVVKTGAESSILTSYRRRWVVIQDGELLWYRNDREDELRNKLSLSHYRAKKVANVSKYGYGVELSRPGGGRTMRLYVESRARRRELIDALQEEIRRTTAQSK